MGGEAHDGDTVTLTVNGDELHRHGVAAGKTFSINVPGAELVADADFTIQASISSTDAAGNVGTARTTESYTVDVTAPAPTITLTSNITADDIINAAEAGGNVAITGTVGGDAHDRRHGDADRERHRLHRHGGGGQHLLASTCRARRWWPMRTSPSRRRSARRMRRATWARRRDTETYTVDVTAPAPTITLTSSITADDVINAAEAGGNDRDHRHGGRRRRTTATR